MKKLKGYEIRQMWLDFFKSKGHSVIPSASLVPHDDPTLLWINAGVAPLKKYFDGREKPQNPRMTNAQKSIRTNDIDNVGRTSRHHTFFEMLGNFSIGDYFREEVLTWAYELLFSEKWFGLPKEKVYITYYPDDKETHEKWMSLGVEDSHLVPLEGNFWEIGEGPCGPDTEIFFDRGEKYDPEHIGIRLLEEDIDNDRYIEIWNIVFSQYNSITGVKREDYPELPSKNIDTGSGLERLACIFQGTESNYETDLFMPLIKFVEDYTHHQYDESPEVKMAFRVIVDHIRSVTFAVADGAMLSNEGRGYVLRRILRRAVRYGRKLGINEPFLYKMVQVVVDIMKPYYTYLEEKQPIVEKIIKNEEENFLKTLESGEKRLGEIIKNTKGNKISGEDAFLLYDTFGFPIELTEEVAADSNKTVDLVGFKACLEAQKERARNARSNEQSMNKQNEDFLSFKKESSFVGYDTLNCTSEVIGLFKDGKATTEATGDAIIVLKETPFYAEMGGQVGDQGTFVLDGNSFSVVNTFKLPNGQHAHNVELGDLTVKLGDKIEAEVDEVLRNETNANHSCTHLLNEALRKTLGSHVAQQGSLCAPNRLRFDFNHFTNPTNEELLKIEKTVNDAIKANYKVNTLILSIDEARKTGAQAVFGEKYGDIVRVVDMDFSKEFCGGTHVKQTGDIKKFALLSIESKGSGIFRVEGATGVNVYEQCEEAVDPMKQEILTINDKLNDLYALAEKNNIKLDHVELTIPEIVGSYQDVLNYRQAVEEAHITLKQLEKAYDTMFRSNNSKGFKEYLDRAVVKDGVTYVIEKVEGQNVDVLKDIVDKIAAEVEKCVIFFANIINNGKIIFIAKSKGVKVHCGNLVKTAAVATNGNGGGRPDFAQAGGKDVTKLDEAIEKVKELLN